MMQQQEFIAKMSIAYMQQNGHAPSVAHLEDWASLWHVISRVSC
ncbi:hypothetical protein [uncultured Aliivibrio sp.]|nr:hypothetical protein [uncultured Aliivibrio sp.]